MLEKKFNKLLIKISQLAGEAKHYGFIKFLVIKKNELYYKKKFKHLHLIYPKDFTNIDILNGQSLNNDCRLNQGTNYYAIKKGFDVTGLKYPDIALLDYGCGYGKVLNFGMSLNFKKTIGIDLDGSAIKIALSNCKKMKNNGYKTLFVVDQIDACNFIIPDGINFIFMSNPFGKKTMEIVLKNIIEYFHASKLSEMFIVYSVPVHQILFTNYTEITKIYEYYDGNKINSELAVFRLQKNFES